MMWDDRYSSWDDDLSGSSSRERDRSATSLRSGLARQRECFNYGSSRLRKPVESGSSYRREEHPARRRLPRFQFPTLRQSHHDREIRLLSAPMEGHAPLTVCDYKLSTISLNGNYPTYTALSYPWGQDLRQNRKDIMVNGSRFPVSRNLWDALSAIKAYWKNTYGSKGKSLFLWCDQICINQSSDVEKNHQVAFMGRIYKEAEQVLIFLPMTTMPSNFDQFGDDNWPAFKKRLLEHVNGLFEVSASTEARNHSVPGYRSYELTRYGPNRVKVRDSFASWDDVVAILSSDWWSRVWIFQEYMFATRATFLVGGLSVPAHEFKSLLDAVATDGFHRLLEFACKDTARDIYKGHHYEQNLEIPSRSAEEIMTRVGPSVPRQSKSSKPHTRWWHRKKDQSKRTVRQKEQVREQRILKLEHERAAQRAEQQALAAQRETIERKNVEKANSNFEIWWDRSVESYSATGELPTIVSEYSNSGISRALIEPHVEFRRPRSIERGRSVVKSRRTEGSCVRDTATLQRLVTYYRRERLSQDALRRVNFIFNAKGDSMSQTPLSKLAEHARNCNCTDPRDRIYAFLALTDPGYNIQVDYSSSNTWENVLLEAATAIIQKESSLHILLTAPEARNETFHGRLPTWVPDWSVPVSANREYREFRSGVGIPPPVFGDVGKQQPKVSFETDKQGRPGKVLKALGYKLDTLTRILQPDSNPYYRFLAGNILPRVGVRLAAKLGDEVWLLRGLESPVVLSRRGDDGEQYVLLCPALFVQDTLPADFKLPPVRVSII